LTVSKAVKIGLVLGVVKAGSKERSNVHDTASFPDDRDLQLPFPRGQNSYGKRLDRVVLVLNSSRQARM
jgi:hypothetical protein